MAEVTTFLRGLASSTVVGNMAASTSSSSCSELESASRGRGGMFVSGSSSSGSGSGCCSGGGMTVDSVFARTASVPLLAARLPAEILGAGAASMSAGEAARWVSLAQMPAETGDVGESTVNAEVSVTGVVGEGGVGVCGGGVVRGFGRGVGGSYGGGVGGGGGGDGGSCGGGRGCGDGSGGGNGGGGGGGDAGDGASDRAVGRQYFFRRFSTEEPGEISSDEAGTSFMREIVEWAGLSPLPVTRRTVGGADSGGEDAMERGESVRLVDLAPLPAVTPPGLRLVDLAPFPAVTPPGMGELNGSEDDDGGDDGGDNGDDDGDDGDDDDDDDDDEAGSAIRKRELHSSCRRRSRTEH